MNNNQDISIKTEDSVLNAGDENTVNDVTADDVVTNTYRPKTVMYNFMEFVLTLKPGDKTVIPAFARASGETVLPVALRMMASKIKKEKGIKLATKTIDGELCIIRGIDNNISEEQ